MSEPCIVVDIGAGEDPVLSEIIIELRVKSGVYVLDSLPVDGSDAAQLARIIGDAQVIARELGIPCFILDDASELQTE